jgi:energy-coupling factor transport system ATP-binding protein
MTVGTSVTRPELIGWRNVTFRYPKSDVPVLKSLNLSITEGEFVLVAGRSGSGKSTLLRTLNGLVPHFSGGRIAGQTIVSGHEPIREGPHAMSPVVGFVQQDPESQFVVNVVEDEVAFALENQGLSLTVMRERSDTVLEQLDIADLRHRRINTLSAGQKQRVAIASVLSLQPRILALDEPTSQLDPQAAEEVLITLQQLNRDLGLTVVLSEHRLERVIRYADRVVYLPAPGEPPIAGRPKDVLLRMPFAPPLVELAKALGWHPLPLTIKQAQRFVGHAQHSPAELPKATKHGRGASIDARDLWYSYNGSPALRGVSLRVNKGELVALMGRNGAGKTTLLKNLVGLVQPSEGWVVVEGLDTHIEPLEKMIQHVGYVPQDPSSLLFADTVRDELDFTRRAHGLPPVEHEQWLKRVGLSGLGGRYPRDLSVGERQRVALAAILVAEPELLLLDEPTRGLDPLEKQALCAFLQEQCQQGRTVVLATHDVELAAKAAQRVIVMSEGQIMLDGPAREVMAQSEVFSPQVGKLFRDPRLMTVQDVLQAQANAR